MSPRKVTRPLDLYVRVSDVRGRSGDSSISPAEQEKRCRALARPRAAAQDRRSAQSPATSERASGADAWYRKSEGAGIRPAPSTPHRAQRLVVVPVAVAVAVGLRELRFAGGLGSLVLRLVMVHLELRPRSPEARLSLLLVLIVRLVVFVVPVVAFVVALVVVAVFVVAFVALVALVRGLPA